MIRAVKQLTIPAATEYLEIVTPALNALMTMEHIHMSRPMKILLTARGIFEARKNIPFPTLVSNLSKWPVMLGKNRLYVISTEPHWLIQEYEELAPLWRIEVLNFLCGETEDRWPYFEGQQQRPRKVRRKRFSLATGKNVEDNFTANLEKVLKMME